MASVVKGKKIYQKLLHEQSMVYIHNHPIDVTCEDLHVESSHKVFRLVLFGHHPNSQSD